MVAVGGGTVLALKGAGNVGLCFAVTSPAPRPSLGVGEYAVAKPSYGVAGVFLKFGDGGE